MPVNRPLSAQRNGNKSISLQDLIENTNNFIQQERRRDSTSSGNTPSKSSTTSPRSPATAVDVINPQGYTSI